MVILIVCLGRKMQMTNYIYGSDHFEKRAERYKVITEDIVCDSDVCVIGSGAAGAIISDQTGRRRKVCSTP